MAATSSATANGVPPSANGELTNTTAPAATSTTTATAIASNGKSKNKNGSTSSTKSGGNAARRKPAAGGKAVVKNLTKESGDQVIATEREHRDVPKDDKDDKDNKSRPEDAAVNSNDDQPQQPRAPRKGGLNQELRERIKRVYQARTVNLLVRYNKLGSQFADFANNVAFLSRCAKLSMIPKTHRVYNQDIRNTRIVVRILDQCCYKILMADLEHNRRRKYQVRKNRDNTEKRLKEILSAEDFEEIQKICEENREQHFTDVKEKQRKEFSDLMDEYKISETNRRSDSRRGRRTLSSDQGSDSGEEQEVAQPDGPRSGGP